MAGRALLKRPVASEGSVTIKKPSAAFKRPASTMAGPALTDSTAGPSDVFQKLLDEHLLESLYKQFHLEEIVKGSAWSLCLDPSQRSKYGKICFGSDLAFDCQILGSQSYDSNTWLWAWNNPSVPEDMSRAVAALRSGQGTPAEFLEAQFPLSRASGHQIAVVACGLLKAGAYYSGPTGPSGHVFLLITDAKFPARTPETADDAVRLVRCIGQASELGWMREAAPAVDAFLNKFGAKLRGDGTYELPGGSLLKVEISPEGHLQAIKTTVKA